MRRSSIQITVVIGTLLGAICAMPACGGGGGTPFSNGDGGTGAGSSSGSDPGLGPGGGSGSGGGASGDGGIASVPCPSAWTCNVSCSGGGTTSITGTVMDPAGANPLYNVVAYVPTTALGTLPSGVPTGADACSCSALFQGNPIVFTTTDVNGKFTITNAPVGKSIPVVVQVGKWRKQITVDTTSCGATAAGTITLPKNSKEGSIPDIAVSTGGADSLECLLLRIGLDASEYVPGWTQPGHVHVYNGANGETNPMAAAPSSAASLWDTSADLMKNDIVLLSCEGAEPKGAIPKNLETYLNAGGRAFASHFHYAWFSDQLENGTNANVPADWGKNLAEWTPGSNGSGTVGGKIQTSLTGGGGTFAKGAALDTWLGNVGALSTLGVPTGEVAVVEPRFNAEVTNQKASQSWIQLDPTTDTSGSAAGADTLYFSFDTPVAAATSGGQVCGRAVFSGLHVGGASLDSVNCSAKGGGGGGGGGGAGSCNTGHVAIAAPPAGCAPGALSAQEKVLEFMLFDLSSCVIPDTEPPTNDAGVPNIPK